MPAPRKTRTLIMGAAGRDFHDFNVWWKRQRGVEVVAFTAAQIPDIAGRVYPSELAGPGYPNGIPIHPEERLEEVGQALRRPEADYLRDGIYELRIRVRNVHYRMLYFFYGSHVAVVAHGLAKRGVVPPRDMNTALQRKARVLARPAQHRFRPEGGAR